MVHRSSAFSLALSTGENESLWRPPGSEPPGEQGALWRPPGTEEAAASTVAVDSWQPSGSDHSNEWNATKENGGVAEMWGSGTDERTLGVKRSFDEMGKKSIEGSNFHSDSGAAGKCKIRCEFAV